jgi:hypothetical protein
MRERMKLRPSSPRSESFEEIATTRNVSREGFYFLTKREYYQEGKIERLTFAICSS